MKLSVQVNRRLSLSALFFSFLLFFSVLDIAIGAPLPQNGAEKRALAARAPQPGSTITLAEYIAYLQQYYPNTDKYIEYSGNSADQVVAFQAKNPGYYYYDDFYDASRSAHFYTAFPEAMDRGDDAEASSKAISMVATKQITVFGAADYQTAGANSFYTNYEAPFNKQGVQSGRLQSINHMVKGATNPSQVMATEDGNGRFTYKPGYTAGTPNNSGNFGVCKRDGTCDSPATADGSDTSSGQPYGDTATQETNVGDVATPQDPASSPSETTPEETTSDPAVVEDPGDIHI